MPPPSPQLAKALDALSRASRKAPDLASDRTLQQLVASLVASRRSIGMTQAEVAALMWTTRTAVSRLESGRHARPSLTTVERYAFAVGCRVRITLDTAIPR